MSSNSLTQSSNIANNEESHMTNKMSQISLVNDSRVDVDWIYRNKKKSKSKSSSKPTVSNSTTTNSNSLSTIPDDEKISPTASKTSSSKETSSPQIQQQKISTSSQSQQKVDKKINNAQTSTQEPQIRTSGSILSKALRPRSNSDPRRNISSAPIEASSSVQNQTTNQSSVSRSQSFNDQQRPQKPIKSLFSAFSKLKGKSAPNSPQTMPISIPSRERSNSIIVSSSVESLSPIFHSSHLLPPPIANDQRLVLNKNPNRDLLPIKELSNLRLRRVTFSLDKLPDDPPQQIPSKRPKRGNVIVAEDLLYTEPLKLSVGISNESKADDYKNYDEKELKAIKDNQRRSLEEAQKHAQEAHKAAQRIANEVANYKNKVSKNHTTIKNTEVEEEEAITKGISNLEIDKPIHLHEHHFDDEITDNDDNHIKISLETIYTRCCHLREILPIPATLKQLKNKTSPLQVLKLLNPKPTLIDIYSFSDFIAIVPIKNLVFDNVTMSPEMLKIISSSLITSQHIEKLSLRNVPINSEGWKYLSKFLSRNKSISKLDISQQKIKPELPTSYHRSEMDWRLFIDILSLRGGIEELIINGSKLSTENFTKLIKDGVSIQTKRLGVAQMELNLDQIKAVSDWASSKHSTCEGLDLGFNDLSNDKLKPFIKKLSNATSLQSISINSTKLTNVEDAALLIRTLSKLPDLRFLDLSNLPEIFPGILPYINKYLPRFPNLRRLHLDFNDLSTKSISLISETIPKCTKLLHISMIGLSCVSFSAAATIYSAVRSSNSLLNFDLDYDLIDEKLSSAIAVCLIRNMEVSLNNREETRDNDEIFYDGSIIAETAGKLVDKISEEQIDDVKYLQEKFSQKVTNVRSKINKRIDELLTKRESNSQALSLKEKEDLLRFYFLDTSLEKALELLQSLDHPKDVTVTEQQQQQQLQLQQQQLIAAQQASIDTPHQMVLEVNEGKETPIDVATGKPVLLRSISQTSVQAKRQEEEEGEFHRWGFFVQQQRDILPVSEQPVSSVIPKLPSGEEIREAVMKAKGIDSINLLIDNVNHDKFSLSNIYPNMRKKSISKEDTVVDNDDKSSESQDEELDNNINEVDEAYDKILNDLSRVRSNK